MLRPFFSRHSIKRDLRLPNTVILGEAIKQLHARLQHAVPAIALGIVETAFPVSGPLPVEHRGGILPLEVGTHGLLERSAEQHGRPCVFLLPAIEVAMLVAARAAQILADLGIAVGLDATLGSTGIPCALEASERALARMLEFRNRRCVYRKPSASMMSLCASSVCV
jgi:hypothetical protein